MMKFFRPLSYILCWGLFGMACSSQDESVQDPDESVLPLILDTDLGSSTDDLFAFQLICRYMDEGRCRLQGVVVDRPGDGPLRVADVLATYYGCPWVPIATERQGTTESPVWTDYRDLADYADASGQLLFRRTLTDLSQVPDAHLLYRRLLAQAEDHSVVICSMGFLTSLARLLQSAPDDHSPFTGVELVRRKVKALYLMAGDFSGYATEPEYNLVWDMPATKAFFSLWPREVDCCLSPSNVGGGVVYPTEEVLADLSWTDVHPIKQVYQRVTVDDVQYMWDPLVVIHAVQGDAFFHLSGRGEVSVSDDGFTSFTPSAAGCFRYQLPGDEAWVRGVLDLLRRSSAAR